jgi:hypothetical protein
LLQVIAVSRRATAYCTAPPLAALRGRHAAAGGQAGQRRGGGAPVSGGHRHPRRPLRRAQERANSAGVRGGYCQHLPDRGAGVRLSGCRCVHGGLLLRAARDFVCTFCCPPCARCGPRCWSPPAARRVHRRISRGRGGQRAAAQQPSCRAAGWRRQGARPSRAPCALPRSARRGNRAVWAAGRARARALGVWRCGWSPSGRGAACPARVVPLGAKPVAAGAAVPRHPGGPGGRGAGRLQAGQQGGGGCGGLHPPRVVAVRSGRGAGAGSCAPGRRWA